MNFQQNISQSPYIDAVWQATCTNSSVFISPALGNVELIITRFADHSRLSIWGASSSSISVVCPSNADVLGIRLRMGINVEIIPTQNLINRHIFMPTVNDNAFELGGTKWQIPDATHVEIFVKKLVQSGYLTYNPIIGNVLDGRSVDLSTRSIQRHFQETIGISQRTLYQIERAHRAQMLLEKGVSILDTVHKLDYFDQPHLTRCLKRFIGYTPAQVVSRNQLA